MSESAASMSTGLLAKRAVPVPPACAMVVSSLRSLVRVTDRPMSNTLLCSRAPATVALTKARAAAGGPLVPLGPLPSQVSTPSVSCTST